MPKNFFAICMTLTALWLVGCTASSPVPETPRPIPSSTSPRLSSPTSTQVPASTPTQAPTSTPTITPIATPDTTTLIDSIKKVGDYQAWIVSKPNPPARGSNIFQATIVDANGNAIENAKITFDLDMTNMNMGRNVVQTTYKSAGQYEGTVFFSMGGPWRVILNIQRAGQPDVSGQFNFSVSR